MKVTEKKFLNVHQTLSPLLPTVNGVSAKDLEAAKAAAVATAADKVMVSVVYSIFPLNTDPALTRHHEG